VDGHWRGAWALALLTLTALLATCTGEPGPSTTPTPPTPSSAVPTPTTPATASLPPTAEPSAPPTPTAAPGRLGASWRAVATTPPNWGAWAVTVTAAGSGWTGVAVASEGSAPMAWTSVDGFAWQQGPALPLPAGVTSVELAAMTSSGTDVYALGSAWAQNATGPGAIVWRSRAGGSWEVIGSGDLFEFGPCPAGCASASSIAASATGVVVAGYRVKAVKSGFELETDLWSTFDGSSWVRVAAPVPAGSTDRPAAEITVAAGDLGFIAAGSICDKSGRTCRSVTWASPDGRTWSTPENLPGGKGVRAQLVALGAPGAAVLGSHCTADGCHLLVWASVDGVAWDKAAIAAPYVEGSTELAVAGDVFVLMTSTDAASVACWTSTDGRYWMMEAVRPGLDPAAPMGQVLQLVGRPGSVMAMGLLSEREEETPGLWVSP